MARTVTCHCGQTLVGETDDALYAATSEHFTRAHPDPGSLGLVDEEVRELIRTGARDAEPAAGGTE